MDNEQYFTPAMEDFRVGYECESYNKHVWEKMVFTTKDFDGLPIDMDGRWLRTPYLTHEQIEQEGWKHVWFEETHSWIKDNYVLTSWDENNRILIDYAGRRLFDGICQDINTFRQIFKLVEV